MKKKINLIVKETNKNMRVDVFINITFYGKKNKFDCQRRG